MSTTVEEKPRCIRCGATAAIAALERLKETKSVFVCVDKSGCRQRKRNRAAK
jgi:hypothetical protein